MKKNYNIIKISGFKGIFFAIFIVGCLIAGFITFPAWVCMNIWNYIAGFIINMPTMSLLHGVLLWGIVALSIYALNQGNFSISFGGTPAMNHNDVRVKEILKQIHERNASFVPLDTLLKQENASDCDKDSENDDIIKNQ